MRTTQILALATMFVIGQTNASTLQSLRSPNIQITEQNITISIENIKTSYVYTNNSNLDITETLVFTLPANNEDNKQIAVSVNHHPIQFQIMQRAVSQSGHDISRELKSLGLPFNPIAAIHSIDASSNRNTLISKLRALHLIDRHEDTPNWTMKTYYYWSQEFPAHSKVTIEQAYKPSLLSHNVKLNGLSSLLKLPIKAVQYAWSLAIHWSLPDNGGDNLRNQFEKYWPNIKNYCATDADYNLLIESYIKTHTNKAHIALKELTFTNDPQALWANSISHFNLNIESPKNMYPILCWNDNIKRSANNSLQFSAENYVALQNIHVLYIEK